MIRIGLYFCAFPGFRELIAGQKEHKKKLYKLSKKEKHLDFQETELGRIHTKIKALIAMKKASKLKALRDKMSKTTKQDEKQADDITVKSDTVET